MHNSSPYNYSDNNPINDFDIDGMQNNNSEGGPTEQHFTAKADALYVAKQQPIDNLKPLTTNVYKINKTTGLQIRLMWWA
ncbi:MAG: hypothetical protein R2779_04265 [Crocinitomicaceae bacterium]